VIQVYTNMTIDKMLERFAALTGLEKNKVCVKVVEEH
jgi:hypothetical protein